MLCTCDKLVGLKKQIQVAGGLWLLGLIFPRDAAIVRRAAEMQNLRRYRQFVKGAQNEKAPPLKRRGFTKSRDCCSPGL